MINLLKKILESTDNQQELISEFQNHAWNIKDSDPISNILSDLAYDLDFYEPDSIKKNEDPAYFGHEKLIKEIQDSLKKIEKIKSKNIEQ